MIRVAELLIDMSVPRIPHPNPLPEDTVDKFEWNAVTPAKAGVQRRMNVEDAGIPPLDPGFRRDDVQTYTRSQRESTVSAGEDACHPPSLPGGGLG